MILKPRTKIVFTIKTLHENCGTNLAGSLSLCLCKVQREELDYTFGSRKANCSTILGGSLFLSRWSFNRRQLTFAYIHKQTSSKFFSSNFSKFFSFVVYIAEDNEHLSSFQVQPIFRLMSVAQGNLVFYVWWTVRIHFTCILFG